MSVDNLAAVLGAMNATILYDGPPATQAHLRDDPYDYDLLLAIYRFPPSFDRPAEMACSSPSLFFSGTYGVMINRESASEITPRFVYPSLSGGNLTISRYDDGNPDLSIWYLFGLKQFE